MSHAPLMMRWKPLLAFLLLSAAALPCKGQSDLPSPETLALRSDIVAVGRVSGVATHWNADHSRILTTVTLTVDQYLKGSAAGPLQIVVPGGELDGVGEIYSHAASFKNDEDVLVCAVRDREGIYRVSGGPEGKFQVVKDASTGKSFVGTRPLAAVAAAVRSAVHVSTQQR